MENKIFTTLNFGETETQNKNLNIKQYFVKNFHFMNPKTKLFLFGTVIILIIFLSLFICFLYLNNDSITLNSEKFCNLSVKNYQNCTSPQKCSQKLLPVYRFVKEKLQQMKHDEALDCFREVAWFCAHSQYLGLKQRQDEQKSLLKEVEKEFQKSKSSEGPNEDQVTSITKRYCAIFQQQSTSFQKGLCEEEPDKRKCADCLRHNVNCWNSNPFYVKGSQYHCKSEHEWTVIGYRPTVIETTCRRKKV